MNKETAQWYKAHGICYHCGQRNVKRGCLMCHECLASKADMNRIWYHNLPDDKKKNILDRNKSAVKKTEETRIAQGLCFRCGKRPPIGNTKYATCAVCRAKKKEYTRQWRMKHGNIPRDERKENVTCYRCAKPITQGKYCPECREFVVNAMLYARQFKPKESGWGAYPFHFGNDKPRKE